MENKSRSQRLDHVGSLLWSKAIGIAQQDGDDEVVEKAINS
jgi:hypothetical protein